MVRWGWCGSGRSCSSRGSFPRRAFPRCPISSAWPKPTGRSDSGRPRPGRSRMSSGKGSPRPARPSSISSRIRTRWSTRWCPRGRLSRRCCSCDRAGGESMRHTISVLVENEFGVLSRVAGLFSGRGFNIESLNVAETLDPTVSRMTIVTSGNDQIIEQILKQLKKLISVIKVVDLTDTDTVDRELVLIKVNAEAETKPEVLRLVDIFRAKIVDVAPRCYTIEMTGDEEKINALVQLLKPIGIREVVRTGRVAIARGM